MNNNVNSSRGKGLSGRIKGIVLNFLIPGFPHDSPSFAHSLSNVYCRYSDSTYTAKVFSSFMTIDDKLTIREEYSI